MRANMPVYKKRNDENQAEAVQTLRSCPGMTVLTGHDDMIVGFQGRSLLVEWKSDRAVSKRTGKVLESRIKKSQKKIREEFSGAYIITSEVNDIFAHFGIQLT